MTGVMERLSAAFNAHDPAGVAACFGPDGELEVLSTGLAWSGQQQIGQVVDYLMTTFHDLEWRPRNRWLDAGGATEEGVWSGTCVPQAADASLLPSAVPVELPARILVEHDGMAIRRLRLSTDLTGLRLALGLPVSAMAAAADTSQYRTRTSQPAQLRVHVRPADAPSPTGPASAPAADPRPPRQRPPRQRRGRGPLLPRWLTATLAAIATVAVGGGVVYLSARGAPPPDRTRGQAATSPAPSATPPATASPTARPSRTPTASTTPTQAVTQRGRDLDISTDVLFAKNSFDLTPQAKAALDEVVRLLRENKVSGRIEVIGYTDSVGSEQYNLRLSRQRAQAVVKALEARATTADLTFRATGKGETNFVGDNATEEGKAKNRRVSVRLPQA